MGSGASTAEAKDALKAASDEELKKTLAELTPESRSKLAAALENGAGATGKPNFCYFPMAGRGEVSRLCAASGGLELEETILQMSENRADLCNECGCIATGVPVLKHGNLKMCQSSAIQEYICLIAPKFASYPAATRAIDAMWFRHVEDIVADVSKAGVFQYLFGGPEPDKEKLKESVEKWMSHFESMVPGDGFISKQSLPTGGDCVVCTVFMASSPWSYFFSIAGVEKTAYPKCKALAERVAAAPGVKEYLEKSTSMGMDIFKGK